MDNFPSPSVFPCGITEPPQVTSGNSKQISTGEKTSTPECSPLIGVLLFTLVLPRCLSLSLFTFSSSSISRVLFLLQCSAVSTVFQLFHCYLWIATGKNNAYSCFTCGIADWLPSCRNSASFFLIEHGDWIKLWQKGLYGTNLNMNGVIFLWLLHCRVSIYVRMT